MTVTHTTPVPTDHGSDDPTDITVSEPDIESQVAAYCERLFGTGLGALEALTISLGRELGLYPHLAVAGGVTPSELAAAASIDERYAQEWLEQQATAGLVDVIADHGAAGDRHYGLSVAAQECLLNPESLASIGPLFDLLPAVNHVFPSTLVDAYRTGAGIPYADYALHDAQGEFNRPAFVNLLASEWLPTIPGLVDRLSRPGATAAEIGCGEGWAAISLARAFPELRIDGFDRDDASIAAARRLAAEAGVAGRVRFEVVDVTDELPSTVTPGSYDLVMAFEMVHDLARPVDALRTMRTLGGPDAVHLVMDERAAEAFEAATENPMERLLYAASVLHCLPVGRTEPSSAATGTVMRPVTFRGYAQGAGFDDVVILPIEHDMFRFYQLVP
jgi:hypothetical protein